MLRKINTILSIAILVIFMIHGTMGSFMLLGVGHTAGKVLAWTGVGLLAVHVGIGVILTVQTLRTARVAKEAGGARYGQQNALFWTRRASGLAILILLFFHIGTFGEVRYGDYILFPFTTVKMVAQILFIAALFLHIFVNVRPLLLSLGVLKSGERRIDIFLILSILVLFMAGAVMVYYVRWQFM